MEVKTCRLMTSWADVYDAARATERKLAAGKEPSPKWKRMAMAAPHSPIRCLVFFIQFTCPYYVQNHLVRHHEGVSWFVGSQRNDRQSDYDRRKAPQDTEVLVTMMINADALRFISRRRLCAKAAPETRQCWQMIKDAIRAIGENEVADAMMPECGWTGYSYCTEFKPCGRCKPLVLPPAPPSPSA